MGNSVIVALMGLSSGFVIGKANAENTSESNAISLDLQRSVNEALLNSIKYEDAIKKLKDQLLKIENSGPTVDFLKLQLSDLQSNYDALMTFVRSRVTDLPSSFVVAETPVEGLHFNPNVVFDRNKADRNITLVNGVITIKGVTTYKVPIYAIWGGLVNELKSYNNPSLPTHIAQLNTGVGSCQFKIGVNERSYNNTQSANDRMVEPLCLIEFDKSVDLPVILNNIVLGYSRHSTNARADWYPVANIACYRKNILAFKIFGIYDLSNYFLMNLVMKTLVNSLQLPILSATVVDSMGTGLGLYSGVANDYMTPAYQLTGKSTAFLG